MQHNWSQAIRDQLSGLKIAPEREAEIVEELAQHLEAFYEKLLAGGVRDEEAYRLTLAELSGHQSLAQRLRRVESTASQEPVIPGARRKTMLGDLWQDIRFGLRTLRKTPAFTAVAVLSLAFGIGANTALFSLVDAVLLKRLPVKNPEQLVLFSWASGPRGAMTSVSGDMNLDPQTGVMTSASFSNLTYEQFRAQTQTLSEVFAFAPIEQLNVSVDGRAEIAGGQFVSGNYFEALGVTALAGRAIADDDDRAAADPVAMISYGYWRRRFGLAPAVIGETINVNNVSLTIIGVTPPGFFGTSQVGDAPDLSLPLAFEPRLRQGGSNLNESSNWWLRVMGRQKPGARVEQAQAELEGVLQQTALEGWNTAPPALKAGEGQEPRDLPQLRVESGSRGLNEVRRSYRQPLMILMAIVGLVLAVACANIANLLLARAASRQAEIGVRLALGASRGRLIRQLLTESLLLALAGGALGFLFGYWAKDVLVRWNPWGSGSFTLDLKLDLRVFGFTLAVSLLTGLLFGIAPALRATRVDLNTALKGDARTLSRSSGSWAGKSLIAAQVAMSLVLLIGAGLFLRTLQNLRSVDIGFNPANLVIFRVDPRLNRYEAAQIMPLYERMIEKIEALPGVRSATLSRHPLLSGSGQYSQIRVGNQAPEPNPHSLNVSVLRVRSNFFETMEMPLLSGRSLTPQDDSRGRKVAVINQRLADQYFADENPLGKRFSFARSRSNVEIEIVGIVKDAKYAELRNDNPPTIYLSYLQEAPSQMNFEVRTADEPGALIPAIREAVRQVDSNLPLFAIKTQSLQAEESLIQERFFANLTICFGALALLLACIGLYGVISYSVTRRTREVGIRMALGAGRGDVVRMVMRESLMLVALGVVIGLGLAIAATRLIASMLYGLKPTDPLTIAVAILSMMAVAALAGYLPARRAARVDPMVALRHE